MEIIRQEIVQYWRADRQKIDTRAFPAFGYLDFLQDVGFPRPKEWEVPFYDLMIYQEIKLRSMRYDHQDYICFSECAGSLYLIAVDGTIWCLREGVLIYCNSSIEYFCFFLTVYHKIFYGDLGQNDNMKMHQQNKLTWRDIVSPLDPTAFSERFQFLWDYVLLEDF